MNFKKRYVIVRYDYFKDSYLRLTYKYKHKSEVIFMTEQNRIIFATKFRFKFFAELISKYLNKCNDEYFVFYKIKEVQI